MIVISVLWINKADSTAAIIPEFLFPYKTKKYFMFLFGSFLSMDLHIQSETIWN